MPQSEAEWRDKLGDEQAYRVLREKGTERPFHNAYWNEKRAGTYACAGCGAPLFRSVDKFDSGTGWPSFSQPADGVSGSSVAEHKDGSHGMVRTEVTCSTCDSHLGHVFPDGPESTGMRYCINSVSLQLKPE